jgi:hypothetical protein
MSMGRDEGGLYSCSANEEVAKGSSVPSRNEHRSSKSKVGMYEDSYVTSTKGRTSLVQYSG